MPRRLAAAAAALAFFAPTAPAMSAAAADWTFAGEKRVGVLQWRRLGGVTGRPGNAHSGGFYLDTSDGRVWAMWLDWRCPSGVNPPQDSAAQTACALLREAVGAAAVNPPADYEPLGAVGLDLHRTVRTTIRTPAGTTSGQAVLDLTLRPSATPTRETTFWQDAQWQYKRLTWHAPGVLATGRAGWVDLGAPTTTVVSPDLSANRTFTRPLSRAPKATPERAGAPDSVAAGDWTLLARRNFAHFGWRFTGAVARRPGNAHSGTFALSADGSSARMRWLDWQCPAGVNPPVQPQAPTSCTLRRADQANPYVENPDHYHIVGRVGFDIDKTFEVGQLRTSIARADLTLQPKGTLRREVTYWTVGTTRHKKITWTAPAVAAVGGLGWVSLTIDRTTILGPELRATEEYTRPVSGSGPS